MRRVTPEGQAEEGDYVRTPWGELLEVISVRCANDVIEGISERDRLLDAPNFHRHSITALAMSFGDTTGREKRDNERRRSAALKAIPPRGVRRHG